MYTLTKWSLEDYHKMIETGILNDRQVELIAGEIIEMNPQGTIHASLSYIGVTYLRLLLGEKAIVREAHPITLRDSEPEPDLAIVRSPYTLYLTHHPYAEDIYWLIEIADTTLKKDLGIKKKIYAKAGIPEYWVIDVSAKVLKVFQQPTNENYEMEKEYQDGFFSSLAFPNLKISVARLIGNSDDII